MAVVLGGCSMSYKLGSFFNKTPTEEPETTGSITQSPRAEASVIPDSDLSYAQAAAIEVVTKDDKNISQSWENPRTGARGTVTPLARTSSADGMVCRDFLASYVTGTAEAWWEGQACKLGEGRWEVRSMTPWKRG